MRRHPHDQLRLRRNRLSYFGFMWAGNGLITALLLMSYFSLQTLQDPYSTTLLVTYALFQTSLCFVVYGALLFFPSLKPHLWLGAGESIRLAFLFGNAVVFARLDLHMTSSFVLYSISAPGFWASVGIDPLMILAILLVFACAGGLQWSMWRMWLRWLRWRQRHTGRDPLTMVVAICGVTCTLLLALHNIPDTISTKMRRQLPLFSWITPFQEETAIAREVDQQLQDRQSRLRYPKKKHKGTIDTRKLNRPHIIMIVAESLRADMLNLQDMPFTYQLMKRRPGLRSWYHYSGGHQTWEGTFSQLYALRGYHRDLFRYQNIPPYPMKLLKKMGYYNIGLTASSLRYTGYKASLRHFDKYEDVNYKPSVQGDKWITDRAIQLLAAQQRRSPKKRQPLFMYMFYQSTHYPFDFPKSHGFFKPYDNVRRYELSNTQEYRKRLWNRYRNASRYVDAQLQRLYTALAPQIAAGKVAIVITGDHGEEFWDHGWFGHAARRLTNPRMLSPLYMYFPTMKKERTVALSSHVDLFPTLFDYIGLRFAPKHYSDGRSLRHKGRRLVHLNSYNFPRYPLFALATPKYKIYARRTNDFLLEINDITTINDRPLRGKRPNVYPTLKRWFRQFNHFYPGDELFQSRQIVFKKQPDYPRLMNRGPIRTARTPSLKPWARLGQLTDQVSYTKPKIPNPTNIKLGRYVELLGYKLSRKRVRAGDTFQLTLYWFCRAKVPKNWRTYLHLKRSVKPTFVNVTKAPVWGLYPERKWQPGQYIIDQRTIWTHHAWEPAKTSITVGMYNTRTHKRAAIRRDEKPIKKAVIAEINVR